MTPDPGAALFSIITGDATVAALIVARFYPITAPQNVTKPYATYQRIGGVRHRSVDGPAGLASPRYQVDAWATDIDEARSLSAAIRRAIDGFKGDAGGLTIHEIVMDDEPFEDFEPDTLLYRASADYIVWHEED
jgi:hypothetical protein